MINLLSVPTLNPSTCSVNSNNVAVYTVNNNLNQYYSFNAADTTTSTGCGTYFGSYNIAPPSYACASTANKNQMFSKNFPDWISTINSAMDLRGFYVSCNSAGTAYVPYLNNNADVLNSKSPITKHAVAFTTESIFYAQSGYFVTVVMVQWSNVFACKSRKVKYI